VDGVLIDGGSVSVAFRRTQGVNVLNWARMEFFAYAFGRCKRRIVGLSCVRVITFLLLEMQVHSVVCDGALYVIVDSQFKYSTPYPSDILKYRVLLCASTYASFHTHPKVTLHARYPAQSFLQVLVSCTYLQYSLGSAHGGNGYPKSYLL
jgi:uncharacterized CHY-type Zn-finger protein